MLEADLYTSNVLTGKQRYKACRSARTKVYGRLVRITRHVSLYLSTKSKS